MKCLVVHDPFSLTPEGTKANPTPEPVGYVRGDIVKEPATQQAIRDAGLGRFCAETDIDESFFEPDPPAAKAKSGADQ